MKHEVPLILEVEAKDRDAALDRAVDVADGLGEVFDGCSATAVTSDNHNVLEKMRISPKGVG